MKSKNLFSGAVLLLFCNLSVVQQITAQSWVEKENLYIALNSACSFSIGDKGYIVTGELWNYSLSEKLLEYDQQTDTWTQKADFGGSARMHATGFSVNGKGYIGTGATPGMPWVWFSDFWEYDPDTDSWTQKEDFPSTRYAAAGFSIGDKGYICGGDDSIPWEICLMTYGNTMFKLE